MPKHASGSEAPPEGKKQWVSKARLEKLAKKLIKKYHPRLVGIPILYFWRIQKLRSGLAIGTCGLIPSKWAEALNTFTPSGSDFYLCITINYEWWQMADKKSRRHLMDHELCHAGIDEDGEPFIIDHDIEEFYVIIKRYGVKLKTLRDHGSIEYVPDEEDDEEEED